MCRILSFILLAIVVWNTTLKSQTITETATEILQKTIHTIDTIETIYYKQDMYRSDPQNSNDTIFRYREMYFKRLRVDSIVGVKGHWYMYTNNQVDVTYEDIYDGNKLIRKNNRDSVSRIYDLEKYPAFKKTHFWSHNTLYGMQHEFKYILDNSDSYTIDRLNDTSMDSKHCYQILIKLENKTTMPGFFINMEDMQGHISETIYYIDKKTNYLIGMKNEFYSVENQKEKIFLDQRYYDITFNLEIDDTIQFNTTDESIEGYERIEMTQ
jgi:hypothetical protein